MGSKTFRAASNASIAKQLSMLRRSTQYVTTFYKKSSACLQRLLVRLVLSLSNMAVRGSHACESSLLIRYRALSASCRCGPWAEGKRLFLRLNEFTIVRRIEIQ
jgi:hypothetical protein